MIILQTLPSVAIGRFTRWFHRTDRDWLAGRTAGLAMFPTILNPMVEHRDVRVVLCLHGQFVRPDQASRAHG